MKIDGVDPITNSQHRLLAEGARKHHAAGHGQTAQGRQMAESQVKAPRPAENSGQAQAQNAGRDAARADQADVVELQAMASTVKHEFAQAGVFPAPSRFAGVTLVSSVDLVQLGSKAGKVEVTPMDRAQMIMVRQLIRRMSGKDVQVRTPGQLAAEVHQAEASKTPPAETTKTAEADSSPWTGPVLLQTADAQTVESSMQVDTGGARTAEQDQPGAPEPMVVAFDGPAETVPDGPFTFRVEREQTGNEPGQALRVYASSPGAEEKLVAVGDRDTGAVYVGHLSGQPEPEPTEQNRAPQPLEPQAGPEQNPRLDVSL